MTKKQKLEFEERYELLKKHILFAIGAEVDARGYIVDQDTMTPVNCKGKTIKYNNIIHYGVDIKFDPLLNRRLMITLFELFLEKDSELSDVYYRTYYDQSNDNGQTCLLVHTDNEIISSDYFFNDNLKYIDMIFKISGSSNLLMFPLNYFDNEDIRKLL